jgi:hypothetical protein
MVQLAFAAAVLTMLGAGEVSCRTSLAWAFLRREGNCANARRPNLILLDLNLPKKDGRGGGGTQGEPGTEEHSGGYLDDFRIRDGCPGELSAPGELLHHQACGPRGFLKVVRSIDSFSLSLVKLLNSLSFIPFFIWILRAKCSRALTYT